MTPPRRADKARRDQRRMVAQIGIRQLKRLRQQMRQQAAKDNA